MTVKNGLICAALGVLIAGCANIIPPTGGKMDTTPPKLISVSPSDSLLNTRVTRITMRFDEYVTVAEAAKELRVSPTLRSNASMSYSGKTVTIKIPDSLLENNTTYTVNPGKSIRDIHESNIYPAKNFIFSTGSWFDSLEIKGSVEVASTGRKDSSGSTKVMLYAATDSFTSVLKHKPLYTTVTDSKGNFSLVGLPSKSFHIYALSETDNSMVFDKDEELIGFYDATVHPATDTAPVLLRIFREEPDSTRLKADKTQLQSGRISKAPAGSAGPALDAKVFEYRVQTDTGKTDKRTFEINRPLTIYFSRKADSIFVNRIALSSDSSDIELEQQFEYTLDSSKKKMEIISNWQQDRVYTLRLLKGFAKDSSLTDAMPSKWRFHSKKDEDYGTLEIRVPEKYRSPGYLISVKRGDDSVFLKPVDTTVFRLNLLDPGSYSVYIIRDTNKDAIWTTGSLKSKRQPEQVIPYPEIIMIKEGWEHRIDFEPKKK
ncbi:MAG: Ig-like domain-containing protein [Chitinophagaceae bacterium]